MISAAGTCGNDATFLPEPILLACLEIPNFGPDEMARVGRIKKFLTAAVSASGISTHKTIFMFKIKIPHK
ncbi:MAG TPA: hypothetical protein VLR29_11360 [Flavobacterium sp.]|nr:hypothetical protein [Flavobacterium sp.]